VSKASTSQISKADATESQTKNISSFKNVQNNRSILVHIYYPPDGQGKGNFPYTAKSGECVTELTYFCNGQRKKLTFAVFFDYPTSTYLCTVQFEFKIHNYF
jgi:hypothetical protein